MKKTMAKKPKILKVVRTDAFVLIRHELSRKTEQATTPDPNDPGKPKTRLVTSHEEQEIKAHEAPLPAFDECLQSLAAVAAKCLECTPEWAKTASVMSVGVSYTEHGIRSAQIALVKTINATNSLHALKTPFFQIDDGKTPDQGRRQCTPKHAELVADFLKEAQRYAAGERSQQLLNFEDDDSGTDDDGPELELLDGGDKK